MTHELAKQAWGADLATHNIDRVLDSHRDAIKSKIYKPPEKAYLVVPCYPLSKSEEDLKHVQTLVADDNNVQQSQNEEIENAHAEAKVDDLKQQVKQLRHQMRKKVDIIAESFLSGPGLNYYQLSSDAWHAKHPDAAQKLFGLGSWRETKAYIVVLFGDDMHPPDPKRFGEYFPQVPPMTEFEKCLMTRFYACTGQPTQFMVEYLTPLKRSATSLFLRRWFKKWGEAGKQLSQLPITEEFVKKVYPQSYMDAFGEDEKIFGVLDGKDWPCENCPTNSAIQRLLRSHKISHAGFRNLTWTLPHGLSFLHSPLFLARISERRIVELMEPVHRKLWPPGWANLGDRGFDGCEIYFFYMNAMLTPHFKNEAGQFTTIQMADDEKIAPLRATSETFNSRMTNDRGTSGVIRRELFEHISDMVHWAHARGNLGQPLAGPSGYPDDYFTHNPAAWHKAQESL